MSLVQQGVRDESSSLLHARNIAEPVLFDRSLRENILYGCGETKSDTQITEACRAANLAQMIAEMPEVSEQHVYSCA